MNQQNKSPVASMFGSCYLNSQSRMYVVMMRSTMYPSISLKKKTLETGRAKDLRGQVIEEVVHVGLEATSRDVRSWGEEDTCLFY